MQKKNKEKPSCKNFFPLLTRPSLLHLVLCRPLQVKLMKYICKQLQCKLKVPETERPQALDTFPHLGDWLRTVSLRAELIEVTYEHAALGMWKSGVLRL